MKECKKRSMFRVLLRYHRMEVFNFPPLGRLARRRYVKPKYHFYVNMMSCFVWYLQYVLLRVCGVQLFSLFVYW